MREEYRKILSYGTEQALGSHSVSCDSAAWILERLINGNRSYQSLDHNPALLTSERRADTADHGQTPCAVIMCCADSRVPPEHIFDAGIGELFVVRNAGNLMGRFCVGSVEYAVEHLGTPLVVVMGHTHCGAVASAIAKGKEEGSLAMILAEVTEGIGEEREPRAAEKKNLLHSMKKLGGSAILQKLHEEGKVEFAAAIYDIKSGKVEFIKDE